MQDLDAASAYRATEAFLPLAAGTTARLASSEAALLFTSRSITAGQNLAISSMEITTATALEVKSVSPLTDQDWPLAPLEMMMAETGLAAYQFMSSKAVPGQSSAAILMGLVQMIAQAYH